MRRNQQGIVLFFSLIVLIIMTVIGVALAVNSTQSLRMAGAGAERIEAKALADGGLAEVLAAKSKAYLATLSQIDTDNSYSGGAQVLTPLPLVDDGSGNLIVKQGTFPCLPNPKANQSNKFGCRKVEISSQVNFGREKLGQIIVVTGIEQERFK